MHVLTGEREERPTNYHCKDLFVSKLMEAGGCGECWVRTTILYFLDWRPQRVKAESSCYFCWEGGGGGDVTRVDRVDRVKGGGCAL